MDNHVPSAGNGTEAELRAAQAVGVIPGSIGAYIDGAAWQAEGGATQPPADGPFKPWRDNRYLWSPDAPAATYVVFDRDDAGKIRGAAAGPRAGKGKSGNPETQGGPASTDDMLRVYNLGQQRFLSEYGDNFGGKIPHLKFMTYQPAEAARFSPGGAPDGSVVDYPLAVVYGDVSLYTSFPPDVVIVFDPSGEPVWLKWGEYAHTHKPVTAAVPGAFALSSRELMGAVNAIENDPAMTLDQKAAAVRQAAK